MKKNKDEKTADKALLRLQLFEQARAIPNASETAKNEKKNPEKNSETFLTKNKKDAKPKRRKK